ncbi:MAG: serine/threonine protein kinase [Candidatus Hydrogenedentes bacterium]|nr:serine/threonine protein kinase [Candidatus Hydrogenedentota bacterium]
MRLFRRKSVAGGEDMIGGDERAEVNMDGASSGLELATVGPYEIIAPIGSGGMGTVYKAIDRRRDMTVAIKVLKPEFDLDKKKRKRDYLGREILVAASLKHECIIRYNKEIIEQADSQGRIRRCLLMELVDGPDLRKHIADRDLTVPQMIDVCIRLCRGLDYLHQNNIVHRDIKPGNFLFSRDMKQVKICDFGLSKSSSSWRTRWIREGGGTRAYMSPEQIENKGRGLDARSDIFSFGITIYELLAGRHPCDGRDSKEIMRQIRSSKYKFEPPSKYNPEIPHALDKIVLKSIRRRPEQRYQSMTEMLLDLTRVSESRI